MSGEGGQKVELAGGKRDVLAGRRDELSMRNVQTPALKANYFVGTRRCRRRFSPPENALDPRQHLAEMKGLRDVVVCPDFQPHNAVEHVVTPRQHNDPDI